VIIQCLKNSKTKLSSEPVINAIINSCTDGYEAIYLLAKLGGHPRLQDNVTTQLALMQTREMSLITYLSMWQNFLYLEFLNGVHYSQWYWLDTFLKNAHPEVRVHLNRNLEKELIKYGPSDVLPSSIYPEKIIGRLSSINNTVPGINLLTDKPFEMKKNMVVREVQEIGEPQDATDESAVVNALIHALSSRGGNNKMKADKEKLPDGCVLCKGPHSVYNCPSIQDIAASEQQLRLVLGALKKNNKTEQKINALSETAEDDQQGADDAREHRRHVRIFSKPADHVQGQ
jgi:hypothetical protein